jgi:hypothetical protein
MNFNPDHPSFVTFLEHVTYSIKNEVDMSKYFKLSPDKKLSIQYIVFKLFENAIKHRASFTDDEKKSIISLLMKRNIIDQYFEFNGVLFDILNNYDHIQESTKPKKRTRKVTLTKNDKI